MLTKEDQSAIYELEKYLPKNPRQIKRYINIYVLSRYFLCNLSECETYNPRILASWLLICCRHGYIVNKLKELIINKKEIDDIINSFSENYKNIDINLIKLFLNLYNKSNIAIYFKATDCFLFNKQEIGSNIDI